MERIAPKDRFNHHDGNTANRLPVLNAAISQFGLDPGRCSVTPLSGGFMNANFLVEHAGDKRVFRVYSRDRATAERERDLLLYLRKTQVRAPDSYGLLGVGSTPVGVIEYIDGITLEERLLSGEPINPGVFEEVGKALALIHSIEFPDLGFIGPNVKPGREFENFSLFIQQFIERTLKWLESREDRLDRETNQRLLKLVEESWPLVLKTEPSHNLVHSDFNPKNILVARGRSSKFLAVIDWEFCLVGNGLIDLGNFFRFSYDYPPEARSWLEAGYRSVRPELPSDWSQAALLLDLGNMCSFLERPEDYPRSFHTARAVIRATLERFGK